MCGNTCVGGSMVVQGWVRSPHCQKSSSSNHCGVCMFWSREENGAHSIIEADPLRVITLYLQPKLISLVNTLLFLVQTSCQHEIHTEHQTNTSSPQLTSFTFNNIGLKVFTSRKQPWRVLMGRLQTLYSYIWWCLRTDLSSLSYPCSASADSNCLGSHFPWLK